MVWKGDARGRLAKSLIALVDQVDAMWPNRDRSSDGSIASEEHSRLNPTSDHELNADGVVTALDLDRDIAAGFNARKLAEALVGSRDPRIKYIISNGEIVSSKVSSWVWRPYTGENAHREHIHISVVSDPALYDDPRPWAIQAAAPRKGVFTDIVATVFGGPSDSMSGTQTAYSSLIAPNWWDRPGVALPARFTERPLPQVRVTHNGRSVICPVIDVGPWNTRDPYWVTGARPQAESGIDMTGRRTNLAGIDLTPAAAQAIGLRGKGTVDWEFIKENTMSEDQATGTQQSGATLNVNNEMLAQALGQLILPLLISVLTQGKGIQLPQLPPPEQPAPPPPPPPPPPQQKSSMADFLIGLLGIFGTVVANANGVIGAPMGADATVAGQIVPAAFGVLSAAGLGGVSIIPRLLGGVAQMLLSGLANAQKK